MEQSFKDACNMAHKPLTGTKHDGEVIEVERDLPLAIHKDATFEKEPSELAHTDSKFILFPKLPKELRLTIWEYAVPDPRFVLLCDKTAYDDNSAITGVWWGEVDFKLPTELRDTCRESTEVFNRYYFSIQPEQLNDSAATLEYYIRQDIQVFDTQIDPEKDIIILTGNSLQNQLLNGGLPPNLKKVEHLAVIIYLPFLLDWDPVLQIQFWAFIKAAAPDLKKFTLLHTWDHPGNFRLLNNLQSHTTRFVEVDETFLDMEFDCSCVSDQDIEDYNYRITQTQFKMSSLSSSASMAKQEFQVTTEDDEFWQNVKLDVSVIAYAHIPGQVGTEETSTPRLCFHGRYDGALRYPKGSLYLPDFEIWTPCDEDRRPDHKYVGIEGLFEEK